MMTHIYLPHPLERARLSHEANVLENQTEHTLFLLEALLRKRDGNVEGSAVALVCGCSAREALYQACSSSIHEHTSAYVGIRQHTPRKRRGALVCGCSARQALYQACSSSIRQHTSVDAPLDRRSLRPAAAAYVSIRLWMLRSRGSLSGLQQQHTSAYVCGCSAREALSQACSSSSSSSSSSVSIFTAVPVITYLLYWSTSKASKLSVPRFLSSAYQ
jgi:hypothetical protein